MIKVENLTRYYGDFLAVDDLSFNIQKGQIVGLLGHNGAGKTTIMKMLTSILEPSSGNIIINDINIKDDPLTVKKYIGYLPENCPTYQDFIVIEYLSFLGELKGFKGEALSNAIKKLGEGRWHTCGMQRFPSQGSNLCHSSKNAKSLTRCTMKELLTVCFLRGSAVSSEFPLWLSRNESD